MSLVSAPPRQACAPASSARRSGHALAAAAAVLALVGCGAPASHTTTSGTKRALAQSTAASAMTSATVARGRRGMPPHAVAVAGGVTITHAAWVHWVTVAAKSQAGARSGPSIIPSDPPRFTRCIAQARRRIRALEKTRAAVLRVDCAQLFASLNAQVMDFLVKAHWDQAQAARLGITPSPAAVDRMLQRERHQQFKTAAAYRALLKRTGQTVAGVHYRVLIDQLVSRLAAREKGSRASRSAALARQLTRRYRGATRCAAQYRMADCAGYRAPA